MLQASVQKGLASAQEMAPPLHLSRKSDDKGGAHVAEPFQSPSGSGHRARRDDPAGRSETPRGQRPAAARQRGARRVPPPAGRSESPVLPPARERSSWLFDRAQ